MRDLLVLYVTGRQIKGIDLSLQPLHCEKLFTIEERGKGGKKLLLKQNPSVWSAWEQEGQGR